MKNKKIILVSLIAIFIIILSGCSDPKKNFGPRGSVHFHTDFKVYILGRALDFDSPRYQVMEDLTHVENRDGDVLHVHARGITLGYFLKSMGIELSNECLKVDTGNTYCNKGDAKLKVYLKGIGAVWEQIYYPSDYIIQDLDKILVSYGAEDEEKIKKQMDSVTDKSAIT